MSDSQQPDEIYQRRSAEFGARHAHLDQRWNRVANLRLLLFVLALIGTGVGVWRGGALPFALAAASFAGFLAAVVAHTRLGRARQREAELVAINEEGRWRLQRDWARLPLRQPADTPSHPYATDLDLVGHASLQHLLNTTATPVGQRTVQRWMLDPAPPDAVRPRQRAVAELAPRNDLRDELALRGRLMGNTQGDYEAFTRWASGPTWLLPQPLLVWASRILPLVTIVTWALWMTDLLRVPIWAPLVFINLVLTLTVGRHVDERLDQVSARQRVFRAYAELFALLSAADVASPELVRLQAALTAGNLRADAQMRRLGRIMAFADFRLFLLFLPVQLATLWTFHVLWALERWQLVAGQQVGGWLAALGEVEALAALATLKHDHPEWTFPELVTTGKPLVAAWGLGHPLLAPARAVANDVEIGPPGTFLLITGSNMSGKSTLLRAIGVNVVLAQMGGPVCAFLLRLPPVTLATSMRVQDSLEQGVSYFMAELQRLKAVVDTAAAARATQRTLLFLLDEILHGTNTEERQIAARHIIQHLLAQGALGAVSTHDLGLASEVISGASRPVHFTEQFERGPAGPVMRFDYRLRAGLATSTNALKLMEIVGLPVTAPGDAGA